MRCAVKELVGQSRNLIGVPLEGAAPEPLIELVLIVSEPSYMVDAGGDSIRHRVVETLRLCATPSGMRQLAKFLTEASDEAERKVRA